MLFIFNFFYIVLRIGLPNLWCYNLHLLLICVSYCFRHLHWVSLPQLLFCNINENWAIVGTISLYSCSVLEVVWFYDFIYPSSPTMRNHFVHISFFEFVWNSLIGYYLKRWLFPISFVLVWVSFIIWSVDYFQFSLC